MVSVLPVLHAQWSEAPQPVGTQAPQVPPLLTEESTVDTVFRLGGGETGDKERAGYYLLELVTLRLLLTSFDSRKEQEGSELCLPTKNQSYNLLELRWYLRYALSITDRLIYLIDVYR